MTYNVITFILAILLTTTSVFGQDNNDILLWSANYKLTLNDFGIKTKQLETTTSFAQFSIDYQISGFDFLTKNFNRKVRNYLIKTASWIDTTSGVNHSLLYQQSLFDISEIYARLFRKALRENRGKIASGLNIAEELGSYYLTEFSKRRIEYDRETKFGTDEAKQKEWESQIQKEILELKDFDFNN